MGSKKIYLLLADDDIDDCELFTDALNEVDDAAVLEIVNDGEKLMEFLDKETPALPDVLFLDLNMPRKNGFEALSEIRANDKLNPLKVIIFSTSFDREIVNSLRDNGANHYIRKPNEFAKLKKVIQKAIVSVSQPAPLESAVEAFVIEP